MLTNHQSLKKGNYIAYEQKNIIDNIYFVVWCCATILLSSLLLVSSIGSIVSLLEDLIIETSQFFFFFFFLGRIVQSVPLLSSKDKSEYRADSPPTAALAMWVAGSLFSAYLPDQGEECIVYELSESSGCLVKRTAEFLRQCLALLRGHLK